MKNENITIAENESQNSGIITHTLKNPFEYEGKIYTEFEFNFATLTGSDMIQAENELRDKGTFVLTPEIDTAFLSAIAAKAASLNSDVIAALPAPEFIAVKRIARTFLNGRD